MKLDLMTLAQMLSVGLALIGTYLTASTKPRVRVWGFVCLLMTNIPGIYISYVSKLWVYLAVVPIWMLIESKGIYNNTRSALKRELEKLNVEEAQEVINNKPM